MKSFFQRVVVGSGLGIKNGRLMKARRNRASQRRRLIERLENRQLLAADLFAEGYTQNFDGLFGTVPGNNTTQPATVLPAGWTFVESGSGANTTLRIHDGGSNSGDTYLFGATGSNERAFGGLQSGSLNPTIGVEFVNQASSAIESLEIAYVGEQWRLGATGRNDSLAFEYSLDATSLTTGTWTAVSALDFVAPVSTGATGLLNGNDPANQVSITGEISSLTILPGASFWLRWNDVGVAGADDSLGIDEFNITPVLSTGPVASPFVFINEILLDIAGADTPQEYIELRGAPNTVVPEDTYLVNIEGDSDSGFGPGKISQIFDLSGLEFGANGILVLAQSGSGYSFDSDANVIVSSTSSFGGLSFFQSDNAINELENATNTFVLLTSTVAPLLTDNVDGGGGFGLPGQGGTLGGVAENWTIRDSVSVSDGGFSDITYSPVVFNYFDQVSPPLGYVARLGSSTGFTSADWIGAELSGAAPNFVISSNVSPVRYAGRPIDHIGAANRTIPPTIDLNRSLTLNPGQKVVVGAAILSASDLDPADTLTFTITQLPTSGTFAKAGETLAVGDTFTQADLADISGPGVLTYTSTGSGPANDEIRFTLSDGSNQLAETTLSISIVDVSAPISYGGGSYSQSFDDLLPTNPIPQDRQTLPAQMVLPAGWLMAEAGANANASVRIADDGLLTSGDTALLGNAGSNERALGSFASGSLATQIGARFVNDSNGTLNEFTIRYTGEQWRDGRSAQAVTNSLTFSYAINPISLTDGDYTSVSELEFVAPVGGASPQTGDDMQLDGNDSANQTLVGGEDGFTVTGLNWLPGQVLWLRWTDLNDPGNDDALGIDDFEFSAAASLVPGVTVIESGGSTFVVEGGASDTFDVVLTGVPTENVDVTITPSNAEIDLGAGAGVAITLTFTPASAGDAQTVTVTAIDDSVIEGIHGSTLSFTTSSADTAFDDLSRSPIVLGIGDNDFPFVLLNEVFVNPPGTDDNREYVELISPNGGDVPLTGLWLLEIEGDDSGSGFIDMAIDLSSYSTGANGLALIGAGYETAQPWGELVDADTTLINLVRTPATMENGTVTLLLVSGFTGSLGQDVDTNNDGVFDAAPWVNIVDSVGWTDGASADRVYTPASLVLVAGTPGAATRIVSNTDASSFAAWYAGDILAGPPDITYNQETGSENLPEGAVLTPGAENFAAENLPPTDIFLTPNAVWENTSTAGGLLVGELTSADPDAGDTHTYELFAGPGVNDNALFTISGDQLLINDGVVLDYEARSVYVVLVRSTDSGGLTFNRELNVLVNNRGEVELVAVGNGDQRSRVQQVAVTFDQEVTINAGAFEVTKRGAGGGSVPFALSTAVVGGKTVATLSFVSGDFISGGSLVDGNYQLRIVGANVLDALGNALDGDQDGAAGGDRLFGDSATDEFFRLFGDTDGNRSVTLAEFNQFRSTFGRSEGDSLYRDEFDFDNNGTIALADFNQFRARFGSTLGFE